MPSVRSTLTRRTGRTTVNLLVKYAETSSPRDPRSAISSAVAFVLDIFGIDPFLLLRRYPGSDQMVIFALRVMPDLKDHGTKATAGPSDRAELCGIVTLLIDQVNLIEDLLRLFQSDAVF